MLAATQRLSAVSISDRPRIRLSNPQSDRIDIAFTVLFGFYSRMAQPDRPVIVVDLLREAEKSVRHLPDVGPRLVFDLCAQLLQLFSLLPYARQQGPDRTVFPSSRAFADTLMVVLRDEPEGVSRSSPTTRAVAC